MKVLAALVLVFIVVLAILASGRRRMFSSFPAVRMSIKQPFF